MVVLTVKDKMSDSDSDPEYDLLLSELVQTIVQGNEISVPRTDIHVGDRDTDLASESVASDSNNDADEKVPVRAGE